MTLMKAPGLNMIDEEFASTGAAAAQLLMVGKLCSHIGQDGGDGGNVGSVRFASVRVGMKPASISLLSLSVGVGTKGVANTRDELNSATNIARRETMTE